MKTLLELLTDKEVKILDAAVTGLWWSNAEERHADQVKGAYGSFHLAIKSVLRNSGIFVSEDSIDDIMDRFITNFADPTDGSVQVSDAASELYRTSQNNLRRAPFTERQIVKLLLDVLLDHPTVGAIEVRDEEGRVCGPTDDRSIIENALAQTGLNKLKVWFLDGQMPATILLIWGNGEDLISDYSTGTLVPILAPLLEELS